MPRKPDPERQRRKRSLRVVSRRRSAAADRRSAGGRGAKRRRRSARPLLAGVVVVVVAGILALVWWWTGVSGGGHRRMDRYPEAPEYVLPDLLYLSYLDSLARHGRALPPADDPRDPTIARTVALLAGVPKRQVAAWGLFPDPEPGHSPLNTVFRELARRDRIVLPYYGAALWTHLHERRLHPGYLVFGRTRRAAPSQVDFCAVLTAVNSIQPEFTALIWRDPDTGRLVHGSYDDLPQFEYYGGGRLGDDLAGVYRQYFQLRDSRDLKPLY